MKRARSRATRATRIVLRSLFNTHEMGTCARFWLILFSFCHTYSEHPRVVPSRLNAVSIGSFAKTNLYYLACHDIMINGIHGFFSDPRIVEELLHSFVNEDFVDELDFSTIKKLNTKFVPVSEKSRHADVVFEIKSHGQSAYIYLFLEFQSTVDRFMALRMARYLFGFCQEIQRLTKSDTLNPSFPILIYNGNDKWNAPVRFSELLHPSAIPKGYLPEFRYFKIAINEIPKRDLVKMRNAVSAVFYIENSSIAEMTQNWKELVSILKSVFKKMALKLLEQYWIVYIRYINYLQIQKPLNKLKI